MRDPNNSHPSQNKRDPSKRLPSLGNFSLATGQGYRAGRQHQQDKGQGPCSRAKAKRSGKGTREKEKRKAISTGLSITAQPCQPLCLLFSHRSLGSPDGGDKNTNNNKTSSSLPSSALIPSPPLPFFSPRRTRRPLTGCFWPRRWSSSARCLWRFSGAAANSTADVVLCFHCRLPPHSPFHRLVPRLHPFFNKRQHCLKTLKTRKTNTSTPFQTRTTSQER